METAGDGVHALDIAPSRGAVLFAVGRGIGGFCPGPAWTAMPLLAPETLVFLPALLAGLWVGSHGKNLSILHPKGAF